MYSKLALDAISLLAWKGRILLGSLLDVKQAFDLKIQWHTSTSWSSICQTVVFNFKSEHCIQIVIKAKWTFRKEASREPILKCNIHSRDTKPSRNYPPNLSRWLSYTFSSSWFSNCAKKTPNQSLFSWGMVQKTENQVKWNKISKHFLSISAASLFFRSTVDSVILDQI